MKRFLSLVQPSGSLTIGNFIGSIRQFVTLQKDYDTFIGVADMHSITIPQDPAFLHRRNREVLAWFVAAGLTDKHCTFFIQSDVRLHAELAWIFECITNMGELSRMTQFKVKTEGKTDKKIACGLFTYPVLMAADILIYDADIVPVGSDQKQHVELARNIAECFNSKFGNTFVVPEPVIPKVGARVRDLQDPSKKMSKSATSPKGVIFLEDDEKTIRKKIASAATDADAFVDYDEEKKPGVSNLLSIYASLNGISIDEALAKFRGETKYSVFKGCIANCVVEHLLPLQEKYRKALNDGIVDEYLDKGAKRAREVAGKKLDEVFSKVGFGRA